MARSNNDLFAELKLKVQGWNRKIVFPEALDARVLAAAGRLAAEEVATPVLIGDMNEIQDKANELKVSVDRMEIYDPKNYIDKDQMIAAFVERRKGKATEADAQQLLLDENYFGTMLVYMGMADGLVSGAAHSTADTVRPALQIIKMKPGLSKTSGVFIMVRDEEKYVFADCAINIAPDPQDLAEIAVESARTARIFDIDPRVAMLSFSTKGSAVSEETKKVADALQLAKELDPELVIDGEMQFDAAIIPSVAKKKAPDSPLQGDASVFIFPSLEAGNIGYKIAQRLGGFEAVGPILQGLNSPVNDLSRGCSEEDVYHLALVTAIQSMGNK
ncbi:phosphate acetyltransferase [Lederbergia sp. NSJ-179]|uniref:phosphate acetyltransferase n=1 Tax=Lederbergia sp. NSJ-179 TaxID=2931402 RepID=UPI001FD34A72|nr:phosphate acetyltransferase [Lederbergia sp. NSJ-179]MCJ7841579.1 phosphate acetyltransferase [Lederbergia sp. NSJ-179]